VYNQTVIKSVKKQGNKITGVSAIQRFVRNGIKAGGYDVFPSKDIPDWYSPRNSTRFTKKLHDFENFGIIMDASDFGEVLALSEAPYLQGVDERYDGDTSGIGDDTCGQSFSMDFIEEIKKVDTAEPPNPYRVDHPTYYSLNNFTWNQIWTYRRLKNSKSEPLPGDVTLQNWDNGTDYAFGYLFLSKKQTKQTLNNWMGGINLTVLNGAERLSFGYHYWFKNITPNAQLKRKLILSRDPNQFGTSHGLAKMPYLRDTRRSIGIDKFIMKLSDIIGNATHMIAYHYFDTVATGAYNVDVHAIVNCKYPYYMTDTKYINVLPYFISYRALTNDKFDNLLVAGKTMSASFLTNAAMRLHPEEFSSGTAAGVVASYLVQNKLTTREGLGRIDDIRNKIRPFTPLVWNINGKVYPPDGKK